MKELKTLAIELAYFIEKLETETDDLDKSIIESKIKIIVIEIAQHERSL